MEKYYGLFDGNLLNFLRTMSSTDPILKIYVFSKIFKLKFVKIHVLISLKINHRICNHIGNQPLALPINGVG